MITPRYIYLLRVFACLSGLSALSSGATVLSLGFDGGNGTTSVDQYTGTAGDGWISSWGGTFHSGTTNGVATVDSVSPLTAGGGNYLDLSYDTLSTGTRLGRLARQWDTTAIPLTSPFAISFDFSSKTNVSSAVQSFVLFGSSVSASGTSSADSWKITADGGGWMVFNGTTGVQVYAGSILADQTWHMTITIDPVSDTYSVSLQNLTTSSSVFSVSGLALRNGSDASLSFINLHSNGGVSLTGLGFSVDNLSIQSSAIPEPGTAALAIGCLALLVGAVRRQGRVSI